MPTVSLQIPAHPEQVKAARLVAGAAARRSGVNEEVLDEVRLAVGEACARAVLRHQSDGIDDPVRIDLQDDGDMFVVAVSDRAGAPGSDDENSMALALITALAPDSAVEPTAEGTAIRMTWPTEPGPPTVPTP